MTTTTTSTFSPIATSTLTANLDYISTGKQRVEYTVARRRPWRQALDIHALSRPHSLGECLTRLRGNLAYFRVNMVMAVLLVVFLSLLWHPVSLLVLVASMGAWVSLFFLSEQPLVVLGRPLDERLVLSLLAALTLAFLLFTSATLNVLLSLNVSLVLLLVYSVFRRTDDFFLDEDTASAAVYG
ncbi:hypothetical protein V2J09_003125 [Rumex salicifolius]